jgi:hypothetical protein
MPLRLLARLVRPRQPARGALRPGPSSSSLPLPPPPERPRHLQRDDALVALVEALRERNHDVALREGR